MDNVSLETLETIHCCLLKTSWWASSGIPVRAVKRPVENSLTFGLFADEEAVGFARLVADYAIFAHLADMLVLEPHCAGRAWAIG
jgi:hypothetical protein